MNYQTWMKDTNRGMFKPRSKALKTLDRAFAKCGNSAVGHSLRRAELLDKLIAWINTKGGRWQDSIRNSKRNAHGKGTVEQLLDTFLNDPNFAPRLVAAGLMARPIPPLPTARPIPPLPVARPIPPLPPVVRPIPPLPAPPAPPIVPPANVYRPGKKERTKDVDGNWHHFIRQEKGNSCVPATVTMMKRAWGGASLTDLSEEQVRGLMSLIEANRLNQGISPLSNFAHTYHNWGTNGTNADLAVKVLKRRPFPVPSAYKVEGALVTLRLLQALTPRKPGLVAWYWRGGGGHATMCIGPTRDGAQLKIIDPWHGIQYIDNTNAGFRVYTAPGGGIGDLGVAVLAL